MFNKIIASVISSVVLFACNMKEETPVAAEDAVANSVAAEVVQPDPAPAVPVNPSSVVQPVPEVTPVPLSPTGVNAVSAVPTPTAAPATLTETVSAPSGSSVVTPPASAK